MIHVITGPPCAGKSTYARENAKAGDIIVDFDTIASALGAKDHEAEGDLFTVALSARKAAIEASIEAKADAWIIDTNHTAPFTEGEDVVLLDPGKEIAERLYSRHTILTEALISLGVSRETASEDACKIEHILSEESFNSIKNHLDKFHK